jgi:hypothetical protein
MNPHRQHTANNLTSYVNGRSHHRPRSGQNRDGLGLGLGRAGPRWWREEGGAAREAILFNVLVARAAKPGMNMRRLRAGVVLLSVGDREAAH